MHRLTILTTLFAALLIALLGAGALGSSEPTVVRADAAAAPAANEALVRRWFDEFANGGDLALAAELVAPDHVQHDTLVPAAADGPGGQHRMLLAFRTGFPDLHFAVEDVVADAETVVVRWTLRGTHRGDFSGLAPSGSAATLPGTSIFRVEGGQIAETWVTYDSHWLLLQIGDVEA